MQHGEQDRSRKLRKEHCKDVRQTERRKQRKTDRGHIEPKRAGGVKKQEQNHGEQRKKGEREAKRGKSRVKRRMEKRPHHQWPHKGMEQTRRRKEKRLTTAPTRVFTWPR